jgi:hypothetical protein
MRFSAYDVASWVTGDEHFFRQLLETAEPSLLSEESEARLARWRRDLRPLEILRYLFVSVAIFKRMEREQPDAADKAFTDTAEGIARLVDWLWGFGIAPPPLPRRLVDILRDPDSVGRAMETPPPDVLTIEDEEDA